MSRPLRVEFEGAVYHVTSRGDRREDIFDDDIDRRHFVELIGKVCERFNWRLTAYCLMSNHYHLVVETPEANLSRGMRQLNGVYTQWSNRRHRRVGHVFQGRYSAIVVDTDAYLLELCRYVLLNPVRAGMVDSADRWPWSSYAATCSPASEPWWLHVDGMLACFGTCRESAVCQFARFVADGLGTWRMDEHLVGQIFLGSEAFVERHASAVGPADPSEIPRAMRRPPAASLAAIESLRQGLPR